MIDSAKVFAAARGDFAAMEAYLKKQIGMLEVAGGSAEKMFPVELAGHSRVESAAWTALASVLLNVDEFVTRE